MPALTAVQRVVAIIDGKRKEYTAALVGGLANAFQLAALGPAGRFDITMMPEGVGPVTDVLTFSEAVPAGKLVNVYNAGTEGAPLVRARMADGTTSGKEAHGYVLAGVQKDAQGTVYFSGQNTALSNLLPGTYYLSGTVPGGIDTSPAAAPGSTYQDVGVATSAGVLMFRRGEAIIRG